jgi:bifunctional non-homologous end joining protein LigD
MKWRPSSSVTLSSPGFIAPCLPTVAKRPPAGRDWIHELKHDGYRLTARRQGDAVRIYCGADFTLHFPRIVDAVRRLKVKSVLLDGEGIVYDQNGMPSFDLIHSKQCDREVSLVAFDLLELDGKDIAKEPLLERKARLAKLIAKVRDGIEFNQHIESDGAAVFKAACKLGHEGIVAKRKDLPYESGRSRRWLKLKNPDSPAAKRIEEETFEEQAPANTWRP